MCGQHRSSRIGGGVRGGWVWVGGWGGGAKCKGSTVYFNMTSCFQGIYALGKWLMLNKWSVTSENQLQTCSGVKRDQSHVCSLHRDMAPSHGPPSPTFGISDRAAILHAALCVTAWNMWGCYFSTARVLSLCRNMFEYASVDPHDLIHHQAWLITHLLLLFGRPSLLLFLPYPVFGTCVLPVWRSLSETSCDAAWADELQEVQIWPVSMINRNLDTQSAPVHIRIKLWREKKSPVLCFIQTGNDKLQENARFRRNIELEKHFRSGKTNSSISTC